MGYIKVKNLNGTSDRNPKSGKTWIEEWKKRKGYITFCSSDGCYGTDLVGAHVKIVGNNNKEYIVPLCKSCNNKKNDDAIFTVDEDLLVAVSEIY